MESIYDLLDELDRVREQFLVAIEPLPDEALTQPGAVGDWSVADLMANIAVWESELVTGLMKLDQGRKPGQLLNALRQPDKYGAQWYEENKERDLDRVFADFQGVRVQLESWLETFSEKTLFSRQKFPVLGGKSPAQLIAAASYEREAKFIPALTAFTRRWEDAAASAAANAASSQTIPLTAVSPPEVKNDDNNHNPTN